MLGGRNDAALLLAAEFSVNVGSAIVDFAFFKSPAHLDAP
jgi:hypothetical protein